MELRPFPPALVVGIIEFPDIYAMPPLPVADVEVSPVFVPFPVVRRMRDDLRFPVIIDLDEQVLEEGIGIRVGSQASVIVYTGAHPLMNTLGRLYIRLLSYFSYLY